MPQDRCQRQTQPVQSSGRHLEAVWTATSRSFDRWRQIVRIARPDGRFLELWICGRCPALSDTRGVVQRLKFTTRLREALVEALQDSAIRVGVPTPCGVFG